MEWRTTPFLDIHRFTPRPRFALPRSQLLSCFHPLDPTNFRRPISTSCLRHLLPTNFHYPSSTSCFLHLLLTKILCSSSFPPISPIILPILQFSPPTHGSFPPSSQIYHIPLNHSTRAILQSSSLLLSFSTSSILFVSRLICPSNGLPQRDSPILRILPVVNI